MLPDDREQPGDTAPIDDTLRPAPAATADTVIADSAVTTARTVGDDLRTVTLDRFGAVTRERFELLGELARGGLGRVYRARDPRTGRVVALKEVLRPSPDLLVRFAREALVTANLQHPSIVPVYEVGRWPGGEPFYAMKLVQGTSLDDVIAQARTTAARVALVPHIIAIADALAYAHSEHVIHRDLKPANVLVGAYGETVVIDWGLARNLAGGPGGGDDSLAPDGARPAAASASAHPTGDGSVPGETVAGAVVGTPAYMPPEQAKGQALDERADVYAIGAILYHLLAGQRPYHDAHTVAAVLARVEGGPPRRLAELVPDVPRELVAIVEQAMARAPGDRYPTALGLAADLRRYVSGQLVGAHHYSRWQLLQRWVARHRAAVLTASVALAALGGFGVISVRRIAAERDEARHQHDRAELERAAAQASRVLAERRFADSLEELGRQAVSDGAPDRALAFLTGAHATSPVARPPLELMLGQARAAYTGLRAVVPATPDITINADVTPDGNRVVTTSAGGLRMWDVAAAAPVWSDESLRLAAMSPDGRQVLVAGVGGGMSLRGTADGAVARTWPQPTADDGAPTLLTWDRSGVHIAVATESGRILLGNAGDAALTPVQGRGVGNAIHSQAFSPDGRRLMSCGLEGPVVVHDAGDGTLRAVLAIPIGPPRQVACGWLDDDRIIAGDGPGTVRVWRVSTGRVERTLAHGPDMYSLVVGGPAAARWLVTYGHGERGILWDLTDGSRRAELPGHRLAVNGAIAVGPWLVTADEIGGMLVWDPATGDEVQRLPAEGLVQLAARGGDLVAYGTGRTRVWRLDPERGLRRVGHHTARVRSLLFDRSGGTLWSASNDGTARGYTLASGAVRTLGTAGYSEPPIRSADDPQRPASPAGMRSLTLSPDGRTVLTAMESGVVGEWDAATGQHRRDWPGHEGRVRKVIYSRDGTIAYSVGDRWLRRWDVAAGREVGRVELGADDIGYDVALLGSDRLVTLSDRDRAVALWDATTLARQPAPEIVNNRLRDLVVVGERLLVATPDQLVALDREGKVVVRSSRTLAFDVDLPAGSGPLALGDSRGEVALYDRATLTPIRAWDTEEELVVAAVRYRPDGGVLASATLRTVQVWDPQTGRQLARAELPFMIFQLAWSPDGHWLAIAGGGGTVWLWDLSPGAGPDLEGFTRCVSTWRLEDSTLVAAPFDPASCAVLTSASM